MNFPVMKNVALRFKALLIACYLVLIFCQGFSQHKVVLLHPTVSNIENFEWLVTNKVINIPDLELLGVYYAKEAYNYSASEKFIADHQIKNYHLLKVEGRLELDDIFKENSCTAIFKRLVAESDAILFFGGPDIPAAVYGEKQNLLTIVTDPYRHYFETSFLFQMIGGNRNPSYKPLLNQKADLIIRAFCLGMQTMNVAAGGTLIQDIPQEVYHLNTLEEVSAMPAENQHRSYISPLYPLEDLFGGILHPVKVEKNGYLSEIAKMSGVAVPMVLSYHHQSAGKIGTGLQVIARSMDGKIIEGVQHSKFSNVVGVQFHPEASALYKPDYKFTNEPGKPYSPNEVLKKSKCLDFLLAFWKDFSDQVTRSKQQ